MDDALDSVEQDTLLMDSTAVYRVLDDWKAVVFWLPLSKVTIYDQVGNVDARQRFTAKLEITIRIKWCGR